MVFCPSRREFRSKPKGINIRTVFTTSAFFLTSRGDFFSVTGTTNKRTNLSLKLVTEDEEEEDVNADEELDRTTGFLSDTQVKSKPKLSDLVKTTCKERLQKKHDKKIGDRGELFLQKTDSESPFNLLQILQKHGNLR